MFDCGALQDACVNFASSSTIEQNTYTYCGAMQTTMNLLLLGAASLPIGYMAFGFVSLLVPPKCATDACLAILLLVVHMLAQQQFNT